MVLVPLPSQCRDEQIAGAQVTCLAQGTHCGVPTGIVNSRISKRTCKRRHGGRAEAHKCVGGVVLNCRNPIRQLRRSPFTS